MKRKLNILCSCVFFVVFLQIISTGYEIAYAARGVFATYTEAKEHILKDPGNFEIDNLYSNSQFRSIELYPTKASYLPDSILNTKSGEYVPIVYSKAEVKVGPQMSFLYETVLTLIGLLMFACIITSIVMFLKIIISINRSEIFCWKNVKRLRIMGFAFFIVFLGPEITSFREYLIVKDSLMLESYIVAPHFLNNLSELFTVLGCFIVAEIFSIGLRMKEEQELTV